MRPEESFAAKQQNASEISHAQSLPPVSDLNRFGVYTVLSLKVMARTIVWKLRARPACLPHRACECLPEPAATWPFVLDIALYCSLGAAVSAKCISASIRGSTGAKLNHSPRRVCIPAAEVRPECETVHRRQSGCLRSLVTEVCHTREGGEGPVPVVHPGPSICTSIIMQVKKV